MYVFIYLFIDLCMYICIYLSTCMYICICMYTSVKENCPGLKKIHIVQQIGMSKAAEHFSKRLR